LVLKNFLKQFNDVVKDNYIITSISSYRTEIRSQGNGFYEVRKDTNGLPSVEKRKLKASILCRNQRLTGQQRQMCLRFPLQVAAVFRGYREAVHECKYQFRNERWNCSSLVNMRADTMRPLLASMMRRGKRLQ
jgi:hypothetical protein